MEYFKPKSTIERVVINTQYKEAKDGREQHIKVHQLEDYRRAGGASGR